VPALSPRKNHTKFAQHIQQMAECGSQIAKNAQHRMGVITARKVLAQELLDGVFIQTVNRQVMLCHPACEVSNAGDVAPGRAGGISTTPPA